MQNKVSVVEVNKDIYTRGCIEAITETLEPNMNLVSAVCFTFAIIQVFVHSCAILSLTHSVLSEIGAIFSYLQCKLAKCV